MVVDLSRVLAGPFAGLLLADLGARVIKIERPSTGDDSRAYGPFTEGRSLYFARVNRGKESIALDLKAPEDRIVLDALLARADVLVENFRPGVMARLGYGPDSLAERFPSLVALSLSGFGHTGPWSSRPAYDAVVQGMSGLMSITGSGDGPVKPGIPVADLSAGLFGTIAVLSALLERERNGHGQHLDVAMFDSTVALLEGAALRYLATGQEPPVMENAHFSIAPFDTFACRDRSITICAAHDVLFGTLCHVLDRDDLPGDPRFVTNALRHDHRDALKPELEAALAPDDAAVWLQRLEAAGVPAGPVVGVGEALAAEQTAVRHMVIDAGGLPAPGNPIKSSRHPDPVVRPAAPDLDADGAAIRSWLGL